MWDQLPSEICINILLRVPLKALIKCTLLSKTFHSFITSPEFTAAHIRKTNKTHFFLRYFEPHMKTDDDTDNTDDDIEAIGREVFFFEADDDNFSGFHSQGLEVPSSYCCFPGEWFNILGSVNGVICLANDISYEGTSIIMWNPSIRKTVILPEPIYTFEAIGRYESACGFGFDSFSNDYKVVRLVDVGPSWEDFEAEIYSLKSGCWRDLGPGPKYCIRLCSYTQAYVPCFFHGCVHWVGFEARGWEGIKILKFDMSSEDFGIIEVPRCFEDDKPWYPEPPTYVQECKGMLALIKRKSKFDAHSCSIWVMRKYGVVESWMKLVDLDARSWDPALTSMAFGFRNNGEVIVVKGESRMTDYPEENRNMISVIDTTQHTERILREIIGPSFSFHVSTYVESMALFKEGKGIVEQS